MFGLGFGEILVILFVALVLIGPKRLPEIAKGLGKGLRDFQDALRGSTTDDSQRENTADTQKKVENPEQNS